MDSSLRRSRSRSWARSAWAVGAAVAVALLALPLSGGSSPAGSGAAALVAPAVASPSATALPCFSINQTICVSMQNTTEPDVIPTGGSHVSSVEPGANVTLSFYVESTYPMVWATAKSSGPYSPIGVNLTGTLWNGVPFYSADSDSVWHPTGTSWWNYGPTGVNASYPYWYSFNITAFGTSGAHNFFPGMNITWWLYITSNSSGVLHRFTSVPLEYTYAGAFPYSPYPGAHDYAGAAAALEDVAVLQAPTAPNYNDSVRVNLSTTPADQLSGATLGGAYLDLTELAPDGALLASVSLSFPVAQIGSLGTYATNVTIGASFAQIPGALVEYNITAWDTNPYGPDMVVTPEYSYSVGGNGTFASGTFAADLSVSTDPSAASSSHTAPAVVLEGQPVKVLLASTNVSTSILSAEVVYSFSYGAIGEVATQQLTMARVNSSAFTATIPGMPLNASVSYTITAWDFDQDVVTSAPYDYATPSLAAAEATVPLNSTFFLTYVYDAGHHAWVSGAQVSVASSSGFLRSVSTSFLGVSYPNATASPFVPLYLPTGASYRITVNDSAFRPGGSASAPVVAITLLAEHTMTTEAVLAVGSDYVIAESGNALYFWLNETGPGTTYSPSVGGLGAGTLLGATIGLVALALFAVPLSIWWASIRARRRQEERRITL